MSQLELFIQKVDNFGKLNFSKQIDYLAYFLSTNNGGDGFKLQDIKQCFEELNIHGPKDLPRYFYANCNGKGKKYIKKGDLLFLERTFREKFDKSMGGPVILEKVTSDFFPIEIFDNTRGYLESIANQALASYNIGIYDGCAVLMRKILEILIIECFERFKTESLIKNTDGNFYFLSDLIDEFLKGTTWHISRDMPGHLKKIKALGDHSAHNRKFIARKNDLDNLKNDFRFVIEYLVHTIDYKNWK